MVLTRTFDPYVRVEKETIFVLRIDAQSESAIWSALWEAAANPRALDPMDPWKQPHNAAAVLVELFKAKPGGYKDENDLMEKLTTSREENKKHDEALSQMGLDLMTALECLGKLLSPEEKDIFKLRDLGRDHIEKWAVGYSERGGGDATGDAVEPGPEGLGTVQGGPQAN